MKSLWLIGMMTVSSMAFAETATYQIKGMHCGSCKAAIEAKVCKMEGVQTCKVDLTNPKKKTGQLTVTTADGTPIDAVKIEELVSSAGDYHVVRSTKK